MERRPAYHSYPRAGPINGARTVPNLPSWLIGPCRSGTYAGGLDNRIGLSGGADLRLSVCCRPGRCVRSDNALYRSGYVNCVNQQATCDPPTRGEHG